MKKDIYFTHETFVTEYREGKGLGREGNKVNPKVPEICALMC